MFFLTFALGAGVTRPLGALWLTFGTNVAEKNQKNGDAEKGRKTGVPKSDQGGAKEGLSSF